MNTNKVMANLAFKNGVAQLRNALLKKTLGNKKISFREIEKISKEIFKKKAL